MTELKQQLVDLGGGDLAAALADVRVPAFLIDRAGFIRWQNDAAKADAGPAVGRRVEEFVVPHQLALAHEVIAQIVSGGASIEVTLDIIRPNGKVETREISAARLHNGATVGIFGLAAAAPLTETAEELPPHDLTDRQLEVLQLLAAGRSTDQIANELSLSRTTVRNHIAHVLQNLGVHTRVQAVVVATRRGLVRVR
jgi:DNA-binding CsgD family transcriptional regulator